MRPRPGPPPQGRNRLHGGVGFEVQQLDGRAALDYAKYSAPVPGGFESRLTWQDAVSVRILDRLRGDRAGNGVRSYSMMEEFGQSIAPDVASNVYVGYVRNILQSGWGVFLRVYISIYTYMKICTSLSVCMCMITSAWLPLSVPASRGKDGSALVYLFSCICASPCVDSRVFDLCPRHGQVVSCSRSVFRNVCRSRQRLPGGVLCEPSAGLFQLWRSCHRVPATSALMRRRPG